MRHDASPQHYCCISTVVNSGTLKVNIYSKTWLLATFFHLVFFVVVVPLTGFFKYLTHFQSAKTPKLIGNLKNKKVQIILQKSGESIKEDMALLAWCGSENKNGLE